MLFNSIPFFFFLAFVFAIYWIPFTKGRQHQNYVLLVSSYVFYGWWDVRFLALIFISSLCDYILGNLIHNSDTKRKRRTFLIFSLAVNLGILFTFKYFNFFVSSFISSFSVESSTDLFKIILPVGISFYTFQTLSYSIDIYRKRLSPAKSAIDFFTFVSFFPQLVAGPIERATNFLPQISKARVFSYPNAVIGCRYILFGMFKKVVISDNLSEIVAIIFKVDSVYSGLMNVVGVLFFALQIYCDFSGYSDIAIGTAKLFNIDLMVNFKRPYFAKSLKNFWSRWHISLSTWFRDYVYIPLGGSKVGPFRVYFNLFVTFLISGLWHGANWTFIIWGAIHGLFLVIEKLLSKTKMKVHSIFGWLITMSIVLVAWVFFRAESLTHSLDYIKSMFTFEGEKGLAQQLKGLLSSNSEITIGHFALVLFTIALFFVVELLIETKKGLRLFKFSAVIRYSCYVSLVFLILMFGAFKSKADFIYFQF
ncbi:MAG: alginate O-acetyltransferase complex protein AlgI [Parvicellaceae bacterium]|jgi:alginate O-acetyltransferase complex protein AlgI